MAQDGEEQTVLEKWQKEAASLHKRMVNHRNGHIPKGLVTKWSIVTAKIEALEEAEQLLKEMGL